MFSKVIVVLFLLAILGSLGSGLYYLMKDKGSSDRTVRALTIRISLSVLLFILMMLGYLRGTAMSSGRSLTKPINPTLLGYLTGLLHPHGLHVG